MRIIVCVKQVPASNDVRLDPVTNTIIREGVEAVINPFDTYAVEEALRLRERYGGLLIALSMGIPSTTELLREPIALGFEAAHLLSDRAFAGADTLATAYSLAQGVSMAGGADLIICGKMATDGDTAQVGPMLAEMLGWPHLTDISAVEGLEEGWLICKKLSDDGYLRAGMRLPGLITVTKEINVPRLPSMAGLLKAKDTMIPVYTAREVAADADRIGLTGSPTQVVKTFTPELKRQCEWLTGNSREQAWALIGKLGEKNWRPGERSFQAKGESDREESGCRLSG